MMNLRDCHILNHKQNLDWNWVLIGTILKVGKRRGLHDRIVKEQNGCVIFCVLLQWPNVNLRNNKDEQMHK